MARRSFASLAMNPRALFIVAAALAGLAVGARLGGGRGERAALASRDVDGNSARDFPKSGASDPNETALGAALSELLHAKSSLRGMAELASTLDRLDSPRVALLLDRLEREQAPWPAQFDDRIAWIFKWWQKRDPSAASKWAQPRVEALAQEGPVGFTLEHTARAQFFAAWARANPQAAFDFARSHPHTGAARLLLKETLEAWSDRPVQERLAMLLDFPAGHARDVALEELHDGWAARDPAAAFASAQALPSGPVREKASAEVLLTWADKDAAAAFARYRALGLTDSVLLSKLLEKRAAKDPAQAIEWLQQLDPAQIARSAPKIVNAWVSRDPAGALSWALENGVRLSTSEEIFFELSHDGFRRSSSMGGGSVSPLATAIEAQPEATLRWLHALPAGADRERVLELATTVAKKPDQALTAFAALAPEAQARVASSVARLFEKEPERGQQWAASLQGGPARIAAWNGIGAFGGPDIELPPGLDHDAYIAGTLNRNGLVTPLAERFATVLKIQDPAMRHASFDGVMAGYSYMNDSAEQTREALNTASVPEEWKQPWRERMEKPKK